MEDYKKFLDAINEGKQPIQEIINNSNIKWYSLEEFEQKLDESLKEHQEELRRDSAAE